MSDLPTFAPPVTPETKPFWDATAEGRLMLPRCTSCQTVIWYPRTFCPACHTEGVEWIDATGEGTVYSYTVTHKGDGPWRDVSSYVMAYVELDEGPRVLTNIVECDPATVTVGQRVSVRWDPTEEGPAIPRFAPAAGTAATIICGMAANTVPTPMPATVITTTSYHTSDRAHPNATSAAMDAPQPRAMSQRPSIRQRTTPLRRFTARLATENGVRISPAASTVRPWP